MIDFLRKYFGKLYIPIAWTLVIGILLALPGKMLPSEAKFSIPQFDKFVHIGLFGGFVFLWGLYLSAKSTPPKRLLSLLFIIFILSCTYGISMEYVQKYFIPGRDFDLADIIADMIGAGLAYGLSNLFFIRVSG
jgi:VanZ family protein